MKNDRKTLEELARDIPVPASPPDMWDEVERRILNGETPKRSAGNAVWVRYAMAACLAIAALTAGWVLYQDLPDRPASVAASSPLMDSANDDLDMAIMYYERAIGKMQQAAAENEANINPELVALYTDRISLLRESIAECKQALEINRGNPVVRAQLFASYSDLQSTYESLSQPEHAQHYGN